MHSCFQDVATRIIFTPEKSTPDLPFWTGVGVLLKNNHLQETRDGKQGSI